MRLPGQFDRVGLTGGDRDPLLHQPSMAGVEVRALPRRNELVDPFLWQLYDQFASDLHREDLPVDAQDVAGAEHLPSRDRSVTRKGANDRSEALRDVDCQSTSAMGLCRRRLTSSRNCAAVTP